MSSASPTFSHDIILVYHFCTREEYVSFTLPLPITILTVTSICCVYCISKNSQFCEIRWIFISSFFLLRCKMNLKNWKWKYGDEAHNFQLKIECTWMKCMKYIHWILSKSCVSTKPLTIQIEQNYKWKSTKIGWMSEFFSL